MKCELKPLKGLKRKLMISLEPALVQKALDGVYKKWQKKVNAPGFRAGKTPLKYIQSQYKPQVLKETVTDLVNTFYRKALEEKNLKPAGRPILDFSSPIKEGKGFDFSAVLEVLPKVEANKKFKAKIVDKKIEVPAQETEKVLDHLKKSGRHLEKIFKDFKCQTEEELKKQISLYLERNKKQADYERKREEVLNQLVKKHPDFLLPEEEVNRQKLNLEQSFIHQLKQAGVKEDDIKTQLEKNKTKMEEQACFLVKSSYLIYAMAKALNITVHPRETASYLKQIGGKLEDAENIESFLIREKTLDHLIKTARRV